MKKIPWKQPEKNDSLPIGKSWFNTAGFSADTMGSDEVFWKYKRKEPSTWNSKSNENIPQEGRWRNKEVFQWRKTKGLDSSRPALEEPIKFFRKKGDLLVPPQQLSSWCPPEPNVASRCKEWFVYMTHAIVFSIYKVNTETSICKVTFRGQWWFWKLWVE